MAFGHFEAGRWIEDGKLSDCDLHLTELEYDALFAMTILGFAVISQTGKELDHIIHLIDEGLKSWFSHPIEFIRAKDGLIKKIHEQYTKYMDEITERESRIKQLTSRINWVFVPEDEKP